MAVLKLKIGSEKYQIDPDKLTLGESCLLEDDFGVESMGELDFFKAKHLRGLFFVAVRRKYPEKTTEEILELVDGSVTAPVFEDMMKQIQEAVKAAEDPPAAPAVNGASGKKTRRATSGSPR